MGKPLNLLHIQDRIKELKAICDRASLADCSNQDLINYAETIYPGKMAKIFSALEITLDFIQNIKDYGPLKTPEEFWVIREDCELNALKINKLLESLGG